MINAAQPSCCHFINPGSFVPAGFSPYWRQCSLPKHQIINVRMTVSLVAVLMLPVCNRSYRTKTPSPTCSNIQPGKCASAHLCRQPFKIPAKRQKLYTMIWKPENYLAFNISTNSSLSISRAFKICFIILSGTGSISSQRGFHSLQHNLLRSYVKPR